MHDFTFPCILPSSGFNQYKRLKFVGQIGNSLERQIQNMTQIIVLIYNFSFAQQNECMIYVFFISYYQQSNYIIVMSEIVWFANPVETYLLDKPIYQLSPSLIRNSVCVQCSFENARDNRTNLLKMTWFVYLLVNMVACHFFSNRKCRRAF